MNKKYSFFLILILAIFSLSACSSSNEEVVNEEEQTFKVSGQYLADFTSFKQELFYSGIVFPMAEANIVAKTSGTLIDNQVNLGEKVTIGQVLAKIDDLSSTNYANNFNSNQIKQTEIAVSQAKNAYDLALINYNNILSSSKKELEQAKIAYEQSLNTKDNLHLNINENLLSAEIAYETAKLSVEQAKLNLDNQKEQLSQTGIDLKDNSELLADSIVNSVSSLLTNINNLTAFDSNNLVNIDYKNNLGALDSSSLIRSRNLYNQTKNELEKINKDDLNLNSYINQVLELMTLAKELTDSTKVLFNNTITSSNLSQAQLVNIQNQVASFQVQANNSLSQIKGIKQSLNNFELEYNNNLELLEKNYSLALKQAESAKQNLNNLKAGNLSQLDQASFSIQLATNQLSNVEIKLQSQIEAARSQVNSTKMQYDNALLTLDSLYDSYTLISSLDGVVTELNFNNGDTVNPGQTIYRVSEVDRLKVVFFVEEDKIKLLSLGQEIIINQNSLAIISSLSPQADLVSKKFKVEAILTEAENLSLGSIVDVKIYLKRDTLEENYYYLPLSSINISQLASSIFIYDKGKAKELEIEILEVIGERAKIKLKDSDDLIIITNGNRRLQSGQLIEIDI
jgi:multidrug resistance efflux pump